MKMFVNVAIALMSVLASVFSPVMATETPISKETGSQHTDRTGLSLEAFITTATRNDKNFELILLDQLPLQYRRDVILPDRDVVVSLKQQYHFYLDAGRGSANTSMSLSKLFPDTGTDLSTNYTKPASTTGNSEANLQVLLSQPIARNAFGRSLQLEDKIIGIENEISQFQIIEAYEDYLASLTTAWYNWFSAYENLRVSRASYQSSQKLLNNILERQRQNIALPVDVNKMKLSLINKQENTAILQEVYDRISNLIYSAIRSTSGKNYHPSGTHSSPSLVNFKHEYNAFTQTSRTYKILNMLENKGTLEVQKAADDLLPSTNLLLGYQLDGEAWGTQAQENSFFAGISLSWSIGNRVNRANSEISKIKHKKTLLSNQNKYEEMRTNLSNIFLQIQREKELMEIADEKIRLAEAILEDETENYSFGKISLNDYISAVNAVDENRFSHTEHHVKLRKLHIEWLRLTDRLVDEQDIQ